jgi:hypothetical protein
MEKHDLLEGFSLAPLRWRASNAINYPWISEDLVGFKLDLLGAVELAGHEYSNNRKLVA